jgi:elongation factor Ts
MRHHHHHQNDPNSPLLPSTERTGKTVEGVRSDLVGKIGENMSIRRFQKFGSPDTKLASYLHGTRIGTYMYRTYIATRSVQHCS